LSIIDRRLRAVRSSVPQVSRTVHGGSTTLTRSPDFNVIGVGLKMSRAGS